VLVHHALRDLTERLHDLLDCEDRAGDGAQGSTP
jgi:hypothetical protein